MQAAVYVRISQDRTGEGLGVTRQLDDCRSLAEQQGWTVAEVYRDNDTSATSGKPRPEYQRMLDDIESGRVAAIIAWHPDRLYRRLRDLEDLIGVVEKHDIEIRTVRYGDFDLATPTGRMIARILGSVATGEGEVKADRWKRAWRQRREAGQAPGGQRLYGYEPDGHTIIDDEAAVVRDMATQVLAGSSLGGVAASLNERGLTTARGRPWYGVAVRAILLNPRIAGHATLKGDIVARDAWAGILDDETWQTVRARVEGRLRGSMPRVALLAGIVHCGRPDCGAALHSGRRSDGARRYRCSNEPRRGGCGRLTVVAEPLEEFIEDLARTYLSRPKIRRAIGMAQAGGQTHIFAEQDHLLLRLEEVKQAIASGSQNVLLLDQAADIISDRLDVLDAKLRVVAPVRIPEDPWKDWPSGMAERRRLVELVVAKVTVAPGRPGARAFEPERVAVEPTELVNAPAEIER